MGSADDLSDVLRELRIESSVVRLRTKMDGVVVGSFTLDRGTVVQATSASVPGRVVLSFPISGSIGGVGVVDEEHHLTRTFECA